MITQQLTDEGFVHINPAISIWIPSDGESIRGYILGRQNDRDGEPFYILQLTRDLDDETLDEDGNRNNIYRAGDLVGVFETPTLAACQKLLPNYQRVLAEGIERSVALYAFEVVFTGINDDSFGYPDGVTVAAKRVTGAEASPSIAPPPAPFTHPATTKIAVTSILRKMARDASSRPKASEEPDNKSATPPQNGA